MDIERQRLAGLKRSANHRGEVLVDIGIDCHDFLVSSNKMTDEEPCYRTFTAATFADECNFHIVSIIGYINNCKYVAIYDKIAIEMTAEHERFKQLLRDNNVSVTSARLQIFDTLLKNNKPLKNGEIAARTSDVNRASVYRTLELFDRLGITATVVRGWTPFVELAEPFKPHHHHLQCTVCHELLALDTPELERLITELADMHEYVLSAHHIELIGICPRCQAK